MRRRKYVICACVVVFVYWFLGLGDYLFSRSYEAEFSYPLDIELRPVVQDILSGGRPTVAPINFYPFKFLTTSKKCVNFDKIDLLILVKSARDHSERREAIRQTYGREDVMPDKIVKTVFFLGTHRDRDADISRKVAAERERFADIVESDFEDHYYNMTIKTMLSFRWAYEHCAFAAYYLFTDDDMYISVRNLLRYVQDEGGRRPYDSQLYAGHVFRSKPQRHRSSKWRVSLAEYPWDRWPPYVTAGAYVLSNRSLRTLHVASAFVQHFRFDDVYLGIVAKKLGIELTHCDRFHFYRKRYSREAYGDVIASHGFGEPRDLVDVWTEQNDVQRRRG